LIDAFCRRGRESAPPASTGFPHGGTGPKRSEIRELNCVFQSLECLRPLSPACNGPDETS